MIAGTLCANLSRTAVQKSSGFMQGLLRVAHKYCFIHKSIMTQFLGLDRSLET